MYVVELQFECFDNTTVSAVDKAINGLMDALRYNGQVLGREFPIVMGDGEFFVRVVCPEQDSLHPRYHSDFVKVCMNRLSDASLLAPKMRMLGRDLNSEQAAEDEAPSWQVLYTTYVHTCSPLRSGETLLPIPLYRNDPTLNGDHKAVIKWQTEWQACDEIQMAGGCRAEHAALHEICDVDVCCSAAVGICVGVSNTSPRFQLTITSIAWAVSRWRARKHVSVRSVVENGCLMSHYMTSSILSATRAELFRTSLGIILNRFLLGLT